MTLCFIAFVIAGLRVCARMFLRYEKNCKPIHSQTETGSPKHVFFITAPIRLQSRDIQVTDSDTNLCTRVFTVTPSETARVSKGQNATKSVFTLLVNGVTLMLMVCTGSCYVHACVILDDTTENRIITNSPCNVKECFRQSAFLLTHKYIYIF